MDIFTFMDIYEEYIHSATTNLTFTRHTRPRTRTLTLEYSRMCEPYAVIIRGYALFCSSDDEVAKWSNDSS